MNICLFTLVPDPPTGVTCAALYDEYITLSWTAPDYPNGVLIQYIVTVLDTDGNEVFSRNTNSISTTFDFHGLSPGNELNFLQLYCSFQCIIWLTNVSCTFIHGILQRNLMLILTFEGSTD